jgi:hypothetical protein
MTESDLHMMLMENVCSQGRVRLLLDATHLYTGPMWALVNLESRNSFQKQLFCLKKTIIREKSGRFLKNSVVFVPLNSKGVLDSSFLVGDEGLVNKCGVLVPEHTGWGLTCHKSTNQRVFYINLCLNSQWMSLL